MPTPENTSLHNEGKKTHLESSVEKEINLEAFAAEKTSELRASVDESKLSEIQFEKIDLSSEDLERAKGSLGEIENSENRALVDWEQTSQAIDASDYEAVKESWQKAAMEQFGIADFNIELFKRTLFNDEAMEKAFNEGKDWNTIFNNIDEFKIGESYDMATKSFEAMDELEIIQPGSVKKLNENFGIKNFQRYPKEILLNQLAVIDQNKEVGLLLFAAGDGIGSFDNQQELWTKVFRNKKEDLNFRIVECSSSDAMEQQLARVQQDFQKKVSLTVLSAHSEASGFYLGEDPAEGSFVKQEDIGTLAPRMKELLSNDSQLIANACSSGAMDGWVKDFSKEARIKAVGPDRPAAIEDVDFVGKDIVPKYYDNDIYSSYHNGFLLSKQKKG